MRYKLIQTFARESGYTEAAIRAKIRDGIWIEGRQRESDRRSAHGRQQRRWRMSDQEQQTKPDGGASVSTARLEGNARHLAILQISPEMLRELFQLPDGAEVLDLRVPIDYRGLLEVKIAGAGWPTFEGQAIMRTVGTVTREFDATGVEVRRSIDWGLPSNDQVVRPAACGRSEPTPGSAAGNYEERT